MLAQEQPDSSVRHRPFATTRWTLVVAAGGKGSAQASGALAELCETYWYPLYAYVRRRGSSIEEAKDLTQSFFTYLLASEALQVASPARGRFRSFLMASLNNFLANQWRSEQSQKRGGGKQLLSLDLEAGEHRYVTEPCHSLTAEKIYERRFAITLLDRVLSGLEQDYSAAGKRMLFTALKPHLIGAADGTSYAQIATDLGMTEGAVKISAHRLRNRCRQLLRAEIAQTVDDPSEIDEELRHLLTVLQA